MVVMKKPLTRSKENMNDGTNEKRDLIRKRSAMLRALKEEKILNRFASAMSLDDLIDASIGLEIGLKEGRTPVVKSSIVQNYVNRVLLLNSKVSTRRIAERLQRKLNSQIIERNKKTIDPLEAERLYRDIMENE